jgi:hypothetical protein
VDDAGHELLADREVEALEALDAAEASALDRALVPTLAPGARLGLEEGPGRALRDSLIDEGSERCAGPLDEPGEELRRLARDRPMQPSRLREFLHARARTRVGLWGDAGHALAERRDVAAELALDDDGDEQLAVGLERTARGRGPSTDAATVVLREAVRVLDEVARVIDADLPVADVEATAGSLRGRETALREAALASALAPLWGTGNLSAEEPINGATDRGRVRRGGIEEAASDLAQDVEVDAELVPELRSTPGRC